MTVTWDFSSQEPVCAEEEEEEEGKEEEEKAEGTVRWRRFFFLPP